MDTDAAKEWLNHAKSTIQRIQNIYTTLLIFVVAMLYTLFLQHFQLREKERELVEVERTASRRWDKLDTLYTQAPYEQYVEQYLRPWYYLCLMGRERLRVLRDGDSRFRTPQTEITIKRLDSLIESLSNYNAKLQKIRAAQRFNKSFDDLDSEKLLDLIEAFKFKSQPEEIDAFREELKFAQDNAFALLRIDSVIKDEGLKMPPHAVEILKKGDELDYFRTLASEILIEDLQTFGENMLTDKEIAEILSELDSKKFTTLKQLHDRQSQLGREIEALKKGADIKIPLIDISIPTSLFGAIGGLLNISLLLYFHLLLVRLRESLDKARSLSGTEDRQVLLAVTAALPFAEVSHRLALITNTLILILPSFISAALLTSDYGWKPIAVLISLTAIALMGAATVKIVKRMRNVSELRFVK
jgi:hypothetical protein